MGLARLRSRPSERVAFLGATELIARDRAARAGLSTTHVTLEQGLRNAATWACIDVLADALARTPFDAVRKVGAARLPVEPAPTVIADPSGLVQPDVWYSQMAFSILTDGNAFGLIVGMDARGWPTQIESLDAGSVTRRRVVEGVAQVEIDRTVHKLWPFGDVLHIPGRMVPAGQPWGLSPLEYAAKAIGTSLAAEDFSNRFFTDGGHPSALIYANTELNSTQARDIKQAFMNATQGNREPAVFGADLKYERVQVDPKDSQFLDLMQFEVLQACRFWRVPPALAYAAVSGQNVTYSNISDADLQYLKHSLDGYLVRFEGALTRVLPRPQFVRANRNAILRMDATKRHEVYATRLEHRTMSVNEVRALEDEAAFGAEFDEPGVPDVMPPESPDSPDSGPDSPDTGGMDDGA